MIFTTWVAKFLMKVLLFSILIVPIICFLDGPFIVIWIQGFRFGLPLTMLLIWLIFFALRVENNSLILSISEVFAVCFDTWAYDLFGFSGSADILLFWKYFKITLTSFFNLARRKGGSRAFSIVTRTCLVISLLLSLGFSTTLGVNLEEIFALRVVELLSV